MERARSARVRRHRRGRLLRVLAKEGARLRLAPRDSRGDRLNVELKARCDRLDDVREILAAAGADARGTDAQTDTYFVVPRGRLKVREGSIENAFIAYERPDDPGAKPCEVRMTELDPASARDLRELLEAALPVRVRVRKSREILFIDNVKFHLDRVEGLGTFVEIEAQSRDGVPGRPVLEKQAAHWRERLAIADGDLEPHSYSDLLIE